MINFKGITCRQVWQAFIQETIRMIATASDQDLILHDGLAIDEVTKEAFDAFGVNGLITAASQHSCSECTQEYKKSADDIPTSHTDESVDEIMADPAEAEVAKPMVTMVVLDGIVMGPSHCAYENCTSELANARGGSFCALYEMNMAQDAKSISALIKKLLILKHVINIMLNG